MAKDELPNVLKTYALVAASVLATGSATLLITTLPKLTIELAATVKLAMLLWPTTVNPAVTLAFNTLRLAYAKMLIVVDVSAVSLNAVTKVCALSSQTKAMLLPVPR